MEFLPREIRVGYFSLCAKIDNEATGSPWVCGTGVDEHLPSVSDPWNLVTLARDFQGKVVSPSLQYGPTIFPLSFYV